jgi:DNA invertase Pin-like site-specific DNA recombinase
MGRREKRSSIALYAITRVCVREGGEKLPQHRNTTRRATMTARSARLWYSKFTNSSKKKFFSINSYTLQHPGAMDRQTLSNSLSDNSASAVAAMFSVSRRTVYCWCKKYTIPRRTYGCPDHQLLRRLENDGVLQKHIARMFGVSRWTIRLWCKKFGIIHHTTGRFRKGTKGNLARIHPEMPFGIGVAFGDDLD